MEDDNFNFVWSDTESGIFIESIVGIPYGDSCYWNCYINGEKFFDPAYPYEIKNNDVIEFRFEKVQIQPD